MAEIQVIGAGFSGLSAAYFLMCAGHRVRIVETSHRLGGLLNTIETPYGPCETAANALIANRTVESVAADLGLTLVPALKSARKRYILRGKRLRRWPLRPRATLRLLGAALPLRFGMNSPLAPRSRESISAWGARALGREATRYLLAPALSGVYAGDPDKLSASLILSRFFRARPVLGRGRLRGSVAPLSGMGAWAPAFRRVLELNRCTFSPDYIPGLPTVVALPPPAAARFLADKAPALASELSKIRMLPIASVTAFFAPESAGVPGFGCLFPRGEGFRSLGLLANDRIFPGRSRDSISETWLLGGALEPEIPLLPERSLLDLVLREREKLYGLRARLLYSQVTRWESAIPHYDLALEEVLERLRALHFREGHFRVFGNYLGDLGLGTLLVRASELPRDFP
ncbi:MAG TPA: FAD-dependent oxidoreductase [Bdellovibrionota bacterium]|jgi:oxygen-dependent protoporphyrinogen oxidase